MKEHRLTTPSVKTYPNNISASAKPVWEAVVAKYMKDIRQLPKVAQWRAAISLFKNNCANMNITPFFDFQIEVSTSQDTLRLNHSYLLGKDFMNNLLDRGMALGWFNDYTDDKVVVDDDYLIIKSKIDLDIKFSKFQSILTKDYGFSRKHFISYFIVNSYLKIEFELSNILCARIIIKLNKSLKDLFYTFNNNVTANVNKNKLNSWVKSNKTLPVLGYSYEDDIASGPISKDIPIVSMSESIILNNKQDVFNAKIKWDADAILELTYEDRMEACQILVGASKKFKVEPLYIWEAILIDPDYYDEVSEDVDVLLPNNDMDSMSIEDQLLMVEGSVINKIYKQFPFYAYQIAQAILEN